MMKTKHIPTRYPRILAAMALTLAISATPALAEADKPQPPAPQSSTTLPDSPEFITSKAFS